MVMSRKEKIGVIVAISIVILLIGITMAGMTIVTNKIIEDQASISEERIPELRLYKDTTDIVILCHCKERIVGLQHPGYHGVTCYPEEVAPKTFDKYCNYTCSS